MDVDTDFRPGKDTPFSPSPFHVFEMGSLAENPILNDEEQDKEDSPPLPTTPVSKRAIQRPALMRSCPIGTRIENIPGYAHRKLFE